MSTYSLDSLEKYSSNDTKSLRKPEMDCPLLQLSCDNPEDSDKCSGEKNSGVADNSDKDKGFNESSTIMPNRDTRDIVRFCGNVIIGIGDDVNRKFCSSVEKPPATLGTRTHFRTGRPVAKKFNVPRRSLSSSEFRHGNSSLTGKRPDDDDDADDDVGFMKADKKPGNVKPAINDKSKKPVSYLELYLRRFGVDKRECNCTPAGSTTSICDDRSDERPAAAAAADNDSVASSLVPKDVRRDVAFHRRGLQFESREFRESRSCEVLDSFVTNETAFNESRDDFSPGSLPDVVQPINRKIRVSYEPYDLEDYKSLSVPRADRSLGPDRNEMETKGEWLMRRRTYGDSVSALNRQRILHRVEKLKDSRRADSQKLPLYPATMDLKHPGSASKLEVTPGRDENITPARILSHSEGRSSVRYRECASKTEKLSSIVRKKESAPISSKRKTKTKASSRVVDNSYETSSDTFDDESMHLKNLRERHLEEKRAIDRILKRGLCA